MINALQQTCDNEEMGLFSPIILFQATHFHGPKDTRIFPRQPHKLYHARDQLHHNMEHEQMFFLGASSTFFSVKENKRNKKKETQILRRNLSLVA